MLRASTDHVLVNFLYLQVDYYCLVSSQLCKMLLCRSYSWLCNIQCFLFIFGFVFSKKKTKYTNCKHANSIKISNLRYCILIYCNEILENQFPLICQEQNRWFGGSFAVGNNIMKKKKKKKTHRSLNVKGFPLASHVTE